jgi:hypothetical protein
MPATDAEDLSSSWGFCPLVMMAARILKNEARMTKRMMKPGARLPYPQWELIFFMPSYLSLFFAV